MFAEYSQYDGLGLAALIRAGEVSRAEVLEAAIDRAEAVNPALNAIVTTLYDYARQSLDAEPSGAFAGVPILLKDAHHALAGTPMSNGSRLHRGEVSRVTAEIVKRFLRAGCVVFGKTHTPEYKLSVHTISKAWGATRNPWDRSRSALGSSGGSAAAVAAGIAPVASATDEGGSIRLPASACGIFGLKPSRGRAPIGPDFSWEYEGMSTSHVVTRTVRDSAAMLDAVSGVEVGSPYAAPGDGAFSNAIEGGPGRLRVGLSTTAEVFGAQMEAPCVEAVQVAGRLLEELGHVVEEIELPYDEDEVVRIWITFAASNTAAIVGALEERYGVSKVRHLLEDPLRVLTALGRSYPAEVPSRARLDGLRIGRDLAEAFERYDVIVTPAAGRVPVPLSEAEPSKVDERVLAVLASPAGARMLRVPRLRDAVVEGQLERVKAQMLHRTMVANLTGIPAMSVPLHRTAEDVPIGAQFLGRFGNERGLLALAAQLEEAAPWDTRLPAL